MTTRHATAVRYALRDSETFRTLTGRLGTTEHPRGQVLTAYRAARRALAGNLNNRAAVIDTLYNLRYSVENALRPVLVEAADTGIARAEREAKLYELPSPVGGRSQRAQVDGAVEVVMGIVDTQIRDVEALSLLGAVDPTLVLGDSQRVGLLSPAPALRKGADWLVRLAVAGYMEGIGSSVERAGAEGEWYHQVVAGIDERTTDCCLQAHGQYKPLNKPFKLTGTPRYADELMHTPFHWYCRSSVVLVYKDDLEDDVTLAMWQAALLELNARIKTGKRVEIHPANAFSTR